VPVSLEMRLPRLQLFIGGEWSDAASGAHVTTENPATGATLCELPSASTEDVDRAVAAARSALPAWRGLSPVKRRDLLVELARIARAARDEIATLEALDVGMPVLVARRLAGAALHRNLEYYAGWAERLYGDVIPVGGEALDYTMREPLGVVAAIIPWNTPALFCGGKVGAAIACGNTVVLKPSSYGSLSALRFAEMVAEAGIPDGVVNVVCGGADTGKALVEHAGVDAITFTGSTSTGSEVLAAAAARIKHVHMELGGKSPNIVFADADLDRAAMGIASGCFGLSGQACAAGTRLLVERSIADTVVERVVNTLGAFRVGDPLDGSTVLGPLVSRQQLDRVMGFVDDGRREAKLVTGGERLGPDALDDRLAQGNFVAPTVFSECRNDMRICREEIFGPVLTVIAFSSEEEAVAIANDTDYGLAAGVWTQTLGRAHRVAAQLQAGTVWINSYGNLPNAAPFGGYKRSGFGREGGREALQEYTQVKNVYVDLT
jgi:acyl-CoA reductase-like NAD-dependent aldehyde dehydrogenase